VCGSTLGHAVGRWCCILTVLVTLLGCNSGLFGQDAGQGGGAGVGNSDYPGDPYQAAPALPPLDQDTRDELGARALAAVQGIPGATLSVLVVDAETGQELLAYQPDLALKPASNTKLFTTAAAMEILGEDRRMETTITAAGGPVDGVLEGAVLRGGYDFSWSTAILDRKELALDELCEQLVRAGVERIAGTLWISGEFLFDGYQFGTYDAARERSEVADAVATALSDAGITADKIVVGTPPGGLDSVVARFQSPPLVVGNTPLNRLSHNEFADVLARYVADELGGSPDAATWRDEIGSWAASFGAEVVLNDGSGLSHDNRVSARGIVSLLSFMLTRPEGRSWLRTLSIGGMDGTLASRLKGFDTEGRVWAKTGTLDGVITTSGVIFNRYDGRRYLFSILMNGITDKTVTRAAQDALIAVFAGDFRQDVRPAAPSLVAVERQDRTLSMRWTAVEGIDEYLVWLSRDGKTWERSQARLVSGRRYRSEPLADDVVYAKVTAVSDRGESDATDVYAAATGASRVLIVDGNDRWQDRPGVENPLGTGHDFVVSYAAAVGTRVGFDTVANEVVATGQLELDSYDAVLWMTGEDGVEDLALDADERAQLGTYLDRGGKLMISGSEIGWHLYENGDAGERSFFTDYLKAGYVRDDAGTRRAKGTGNVFPDASLPLAFYTPAEQVVRYPDALLPAAGASAALEYAGEDETTAAVAYRGEFSLLYFGFPFESIDNGPDRRALMGEVLDFFEL